jgi:hypothetical protein
MILGLRHLSCIRKKIFNLTLAYRTIFLKTASLFYQSSARKESKRSTFQAGKTARLKDDAFIFPQDRSFSRGNIEKKKKTVSKKS